jgi:hypothetical protein
VMICDGDVVAESDVADETASPGLQSRDGQSGDVCAHYQSIGTCAWLCFSRDVCLYVGVRGGTIRRAARIKIRIPSFA